MPSLLSLSGGTYLLIFILFLSFPFTCPDYFQALSSRHSTTSSQQEQSPSYIWQPAKVLEQKDRDHG